MRRNESAAYYLARIEAVEDYVYDHRDDADLDVVLSILNVCKPAPKKEIELIDLGGKKDA